MRLHLMTRFLKAWGLSFVCLMSISFLLLSTHTRYTSVISSGRSSWKPGQETSISWMMVSNRSNPMRIYNSNQTMSVPEITALTSYNTHTCSHLLKRLTIEIRSPYKNGQGNISSDGIKYWCLTLEAIARCDRYTHCVLIRDHVSWTPEHISRLKNDIHAGEFIMPLTSRSDSALVILGGVSAKNVLNNIRLHGIHSSVEVMLDNVSSSENIRTEAHKVNPRESEIRNSTTSSDHVAFNSSNTSDSNNRGHTRKTGIVVPYHKGRHDLLTIMAKQLTLRGEDVVMVRDTGQPFQGFKNVVHTIHHDKHQAIGASLYEGYDWLYKNEYEVICNIDSDILAKPDWMTETQRLLKRYPNDIISGFNERKHLKKCMVKEHKDHYVKNCGGGIHYCFTRLTYDTFMRPVLDKINRTGDLNYWDAGVVDAAKKAKKHIVSTKPSRIQHMGYKGFTAKGPFVQKAPDYILDSTEIDLIKHISKLNSLWKNVVKH